MDFRLLCAPSRLVGWASDGHQGPRFLDLPFGIEFSQRPHANARWGQCRGVLEYGFQPIGFPEQ